MIIYLTGAFWFLKLNWCLGAKLKIFIIFALVYYWEASLMCSKLVARFLRLKTFREDTGLENFALENSALVVINFTVYFNCI